MRDRVLTIVGVLSLVALAATVGVAESAPPPGPGAARAPAIQHEAFGATVAAGDPSPTERFEVRTLPNGSFHAREKAGVRLNGVAHHLVGEVEDEPVARGGRHKATITDEDAGQTLVFAYDPSASAITIGVGADTARIVRNPDGSYVVDGAPAATGKAAVRALQTNRAYAAASPHAMLLAYDYAQRPSLETRAPICCVNCSGPDVATAPAVCDIFRDLCDCVACDKACKGQACGKCR
jgi:hypothetical protein